jgi:hypothetical protein
MAGTLPKTKQEIRAFARENYPFSCESRSRWRPENFARHTGGFVDFVRLPSDTPFRADWFFKSEHDMQRFKQWVLDQVKQKGAHDAS